MSIEEIKLHRASQLEHLHQCGPDTPMGKLLRRFWQPVSRSKDVTHARAKPLRIMNEDLTLYRGASGKPYLVAGRCAHRGTVLHPGWVDGETIRCVYHGWRFDGAGQCVERPAERDTRLPNVKIAGYPALDYGGLVFAYMGEGAAPAFDLPRKEIFERPEGQGVVRAKAEKWPCNWLQGVENSLDAVHVSFVHQLGTVGAFGEAVTGTIPELSYSETEAGIEQVATRGKDNVRKSDWTFPNNNHVIVPGVAKGDPWTDLGVWNVPHDDFNTTRFVIYSTAASGDAAQRFIDYFDRHGEYNPADHHDALFHQGIFPAHPMLTAAQDYVATSGQGTVADRAHEVLGRSDAGIVFLRKIFFRELELLNNGQPTKSWRRRPKDVALPIQHGMAQTV
ncbi:MAG: Rieske 2Fe-2S domain-containing protein [Burkholderiales bacterium]